MEARVRLVSGGSGTAVGATPQVQPLASAAEWMQLIPVPMMTSEFMNKLQFRNQMNDASLLYAKYIMTTISPPVAAAVVP